MKKIFLSLLIGTSNLLVAQLSTSEIVATVNHVSHLNPLSITLKPGFWANINSRNENTSKQNSINSLIYLN